MFYDPLLWWFLKQRDWFGNLRTETDVVKEAEALVRSWNPGAQSFPGEPEARALQEGFAAQERLFFNRATLRAVIWHAWLQGFTAGKADRP